MDENTQPKKMISLDASFAALLGGLVFMIIMTLGALWMIERGRCRKAEATCADYKKELENYSGLFGSKMPQMPIPSNTGQSASQTQKLQRDEYTNKAVSIDGQPTSALLIETKVAQRFGFKPGEVIIVAPEDIDSDKIPAETKPAP